MLYTLADHLVEESEVAGEMAISCVKTLREAYRDNETEQMELLDLMEYVLRLSVN